MNLGFRYFLRLLPGSGGPARLGNARKVYISSSATILHRLCEAIFVEYRELLHR